MTKPNFFLIGAPKAGTTSAFSYLIQHPAVYPSTVKETHFFKDQDQFTLGHDYYLQSYFQGAESYALAGEGTPAYLPLADIVAPRIQHFLDGRMCKFIVILRDPVERAWSNYCHRRRNKAETRTFMEAIEADRTGKSEHHIIFSRYYEQGLYAKHLEQWFSYFPREQFGVFFYDNMVNTGDFMQTIFRFLEIDDTFTVDSEKVHNAASVEKSKLLSSLLRKLPGRKTIFNTVVPPHLRKIYRYKVRQMLSRPARPTQKKQLSDEDRSSLSLLYKEDTLKLCDLLNPDTPPWASSILSID